MKKKIVVLQGDGIGPEIVAQAVKALKAVEKKFGHTFELEYQPFGGCAIDCAGTALPEETLHAALAADAVLLGAVGGPKWDHVKGSARPEAGLLGIRKALGVFANLRPAVIYPELKGASPLKDGIIEGGVDVLVVRELIGGIYFGERGTNEAGTAAYDTEAYTVEEITRIARIAFEAARKRSGRLCSVDKANVLDTSRLWRKTVTAMAAEYPDVALTHMYVDNAAMQLVRDPGQFDVILTGNLFGDILSDEASMLTGSIGMLPSASIGGPVGLYEPIHGSAPDIAGKDIANPIATVLSAAMLLRYSFDMETEARAIEDAVKSVLANGYRTCDLCCENSVGCEQMGDLIVKELER